MSRQPRNLWAVILAGGDGRRLGSLTTNADGVCTPKQYCSLNGGPSLLQLSLQRALGLVPRERIVPVVTETHRCWWEPQFSSWRRSTVVVQPSNRGTGLGILLPLLVIAKSDPLSPYPNSGLGLRPVHCFVEKPDRATAAELIRAGSVWSSGIFAGRISEIVDLYPRTVHGLMLHLKAVVKYWPNPREPSAELASLYERHAPIDFSRDALQTHPSRLQFLRVPPCGWSDVSTPARLATTLWSLRSQTPRSVVSPSPARTFDLATAFDRNLVGTQLASKGSAG